MTAPPMSWRRPSSATFSKRPASRRRPIGTNLFLAKVAMDIVAKHIPADENGVRIAELDETKFRRELWPHRPLTDFWRVGRGIARRLESHGMFTMGTSRFCSEQNEGAALQPVRQECGAAHRPRVGLGALHRPVHQGLPPVREQPELRAGAELPLRGGKGPACFAGNGGSALAGAGGKGPRDGPGRADSRL